MPVKVRIVFHSLHSHVYRLAEAIAAGARAVAGAEVIVEQVPETLPPDALEKMGATATVSVHGPIADVQCTIFPDLRPFSGGFASST